MRLARLGAVALVLLVAVAAHAETARPPAVRATIESVSADGASLAAKTPEGEARQIHVGEDTRIILVAAASLADVKPGAFIGVGATPTDSGEQKALEVHIFPESMRGSGEGFRPYDRAPGATMTNGNVDVRVDNVKGPRLTVTYHGGQQTILIDPSTPIVAVAPGSRTDLKPGAAIVARGPAEGDGSIDAAFLAVGKDGAVPPM